MSKKDYISDDLITMRDRLRESTAAIREAAEQKKNTPDAGKTPESAPEAATIPESAPALQESANDRRTLDGLRARQDLANRLAKDLARLHTLLEKQENLASALNRAKCSLEALEQTLNRTTPTGAAGLFAAEIDRLRLEYFRLCGTLDALTGQEHNTSQPPRENRQADKHIQGACIIGGFILTGAALIAGVCAVIFL